MDHPAVPEDTAPPELIPHPEPEPGQSIELKPLMLVDGSDITVEAAKLAGIKVTAEVVKAAKGPKITIMKYKNKTGYRKRQGHRQPLTQIKVTSIG